MAMKISFTFIEVFADVSINSKLLSSAYDCASCEKRKRQRFRLLTDSCKHLEVQSARHVCLFVYKQFHISFVKPTGSVRSSVAVQTSQTWKSNALLLARSALFPAKAITIFGLACLWSSFTQFFARANDSWKERKKTCISINYFLDSELTHSCFKGSYHTFFHIKFLPDRSTYYVSDNFVLFITIFHPLADL